MDFKKFFQIGTPQCGAALGCLGVLIALMLLFLGLWRSLVIAAFFAVGYFVGASRNKGDSIKKAINKLIPPKGE